MILPHIIPYRCIAGQPRLSEGCSRSKSASAKHVPRRGRALIPRFFGGASSIFSNAYSPKYRRASLRKRGIGSIRFSARLRISPGERPRAKANRPKLSMEGVARPCSRYVMKDRASPVRAESSFLDRPRASLSLVNSTGSAFFNSSAHSSASMARHRGGLAGHSAGSIFRSFDQTQKLQDSLTDCSFIHKKHALLTGSPCHF
ncbi:hypothetical protein Hsar01_03183 [Haloferula sargassicola]|uniref:Uncharacterized protein n=1 Tax=Haloferula sargassicola TaxID=490096 RepID=A0ABP9UU92_9BACT